MELLRTPGQAEELVRTESTIAAYFSILLLSLADQ